jgi:hypothetical protein
VNVGKNTTLGDGDVTQKLVQLLIVSDGELEMTGDDTGLLVVAGSVASQLEDFGSEVLKDGSQVHGGTGTNTLSVVALSEKTVDTTNRERETSLGRTPVENMCKLRDQRTRLKTRHEWLHDATRLAWQSGETGEDLRLRVLGTRGLAARLAAASHFEKWLFGVVEVKKEVSESGETLRRLEESESVVVMTIARS